jgi:hypothetical protein
MRLLRGLLHGLLHGVRLAALLISLPVWGSSAGAAVILDADDREVVSSGTFTPASPFAPFSASNFAFEAGAGQISSVDSQGASGSGHAYAGIDALYYGSSGRSTFDIGFTVTTPTSYDLSGNLEIEAVSFFVASLTLYQGATALQSFTADWSDEQVSFDVSGVLAPGSYRLVAEATAGPGDYGVDQGYTGASYDFVFVVPEPATALLVTLGLLSLALRARRG